MGRTPRVPSSLEAVEKLVTMPCLHFLEGDFLPWVRGATVEGQCERCGITGSGGVCVVALALSLLGHAAMAGAALCGLSAAALHLHSWPHPGP